MINYNQIFHDALINALILSIISYTIRNFIIYDKDKYDDNLIKYIQSFLIVFIVYIIKSIYHF